MSFSNFNKCCFFLNLRLGTTLIALICAVLEFISLIIYFTEIMESQTLTHKSGYINLIRFLLFVFFLFTCIKLALTATLYVGILERRPDHLEMWYRGYMICEVLHMTFIILKAVNTTDTGNDWFWSALMGKFLLKLITLYFILVVRSYHQQMCKQPNYYQDFTYRSTGKTYCEQAKDAHGEIVLYSAQTKEKDFTQKGGCLVYATPESSQMNAIPIMPSFLLNNDKRPSIELHAMENEHQRFNSSQPMKKKVSFENHIILE